MQQEAANACSPTHSGAMIGLWHRTEHSMDTGHKIRSNKDPSTKGHIACRANWDGWIPPLYSDDEDSCCDGCGGYWECTCPLRPVNIQTNLPSDDLIEGTQERQDSEEQDVAGTVRGDDLYQNTNNCHNHRDPTSKQGEAQRRTTTSAQATAVHSEGGREYTKLSRLDETAMSLWTELDQQVEELNRRIGSITNIQQLLRKPVLTTAIEKVAGWKQPYWQRRKSGRTTRDVRLQHPGAQQTKEETPQQFTTGPRRRQSEGTIAECTPQGPLRAFLKLVLKFITRLLQMKGLENTAN